MLSCSIDLYGKLIDHLLECIQRKQDNSATRTYINAVAAIRCGGTGLRMVDVTGTDRLVADDEVWSGSPLLTGCVKYHCCSNLAHYSIKLHRWTEPGVV